MGVSQVIGPEPGVGRDTYDLRRILGSVALSSKVAGTSALLPGDQVMHVLT